MRTKRFEMLEQRSFSKEERALLFALSGDSGTVFACHGQGTVPAIGGSLYRTKASDGGTHYAGAKRKMDLRSLSTPGARGIFMER